MKKSILVVLAIALSISLTTINAFAIPFNPNEYTSVNEYSELLPRGVKQDTASEHAIRRGDFLMYTDLIISDKGGGNIGAVVVAFMQYSVKEAYISVYLDRWDETEERWRQVTYYDAEFFEEDYPDGLITPSVDIVFQNQPKGYFYRLRAAVAAFDGDTVEGFSPVTGGILIE